MLDEADLLMEYNKDLSRKEAEKIIEKNKETMTTVKEEEMVNNYANGIKGNGEVKENTEKPEEREVNGSKD